MSDIKISTDDDAGFTEFRIQMEDILRGALNRLVTLEPFSSEPPYRFNMAIVAAMQNIMAEIIAGFSEGSRDRELITATNADEAVKRLRAAIMKSLAHAMAPRPGESAEDQGDDNPAQPRRTH